MRGSVLKIIIPVFGMLLSGLTYGQFSDEIRLKEDSLKGLSLKIRMAESDSLKSSLNEQFLNTLRSVIVRAESFKYPFDSLKTIGKLTAPDGSFRIYNWNLPKANGTNGYYGLIQMNPEGKGGKIISLTDGTGSIEDPETAILDRDSWYGSLYYRIIVTSYRDRVYYTLLGWNGLNDQVSQKIIEVLTMDQAGNLHFGATIFRKYGNEQMSRVMFRYSSSASMLLKFDSQSLITGKKWNSKSRQFDVERKLADMIVCDELIPMAEQMEGRYEYYVPSSESFNGFVFQDGCWVFYKNIEFIPGDR